MPCLAINGAFFFVLSINSGRLECFFIKFKELSENDNLYSI